MPGKATAPARLRCFVAMAFGRPDTDRWYKSTLRPLLARHQLNPRRVDLINHNDDVDNKILEELGKADLVVTDLTYARPSVYFEAGHAHGRELPVIYTARKDHLTPLAREDHLRVHFDLQMRNIIDWKPPGYANFVRRMEARLNYVVRPLRKSLDERNRKQAEEAAFRAMSQSNQIRATLAEVEKVAATNGFKTETFAGAGSGMIYRTWFPGMAVLAGRRLRDGRLEGLQCLIGQNFRKAEFDVAGSLLRHPRFDLQAPREADRFTAVHDLTVVISLRPIQLPRITATFEAYEVLDPSAKYLRRLVRERFPQGRVRGYRTIRSSVHYSGYEGVTTKGEAEYLTPAPGPTPPDEDAKLIKLAVVTRRVDICVVDFARSLEDVGERVAKAISRFSSDQGPYSGAIETARRPLGGL